MLIFQPFEAVFEARKRPITLQIVFATENMTNEWSTLLFLILPPIGYECDLEFNVASNLMWPRTCHATDLGFSAQKKALNFGALSEAALRCLGELNARACEASKFECLWLWQITMIY